MNRKRVKSAFRYSAAKTGWQISFVAMLLALLVLSGCGRSSVAGVYVCTRDQRGYNRHADVVVFTQTLTYDLRSDGSFVWTFDPGKDAEGYSGGNEQRTDGKWKPGAGGVVCYNGDGSVFSKLKREGHDLINGEGVRYRQQ